MSECIFCKIAKKEVGSNIILENDRFLVFEDINPKAKTHFLIVPKKHIPSVDHLTEEDESMIGGIFLTAKMAAEILGVSQKYKLLINVGREGGQEIDHLHMHLMSNAERKEVSKT